MGKNKKHKKNKDFHNPEELYLVIGISDIYYEFKDNNNCKLGIGKTYLLGVSNNLNNIISSIKFINSDEYELSGEPIQPFMVDEDVNINYIVVEKVASTNPHMMLKTTISIDETWERIVAVFVNDDEYPGYYSLLTSDGCLNQELVDVCDSILDSESHSLIDDMSVLNASNSIIELIEGCIDIKPLDINIFHEITHEPINLNKKNISIKDDTTEEVPFDECSDDSINLMKLILKRFITTDGSKLHINDKEIKTPEDIDNLSNQEISDLINDARHIVDMKYELDDFFNTYS